MYNLNLFCVGDLVWYIRPPDSGNKLDTRWIGLGVVVAREGEGSYQVEIKPGHTIGAQGGALKLYTPDKHTESPIKLYYHRRTPGTPRGRPTNGVEKRFWGMGRWGVGYSFEISGKGLRTPL